MARIRTIKPEFWTDEALTECSLSARLLFIGMWNFADDRGNIERSSKQLKMKIFPADILDVEPLVVELMNQGLLVEYLVEGKKYLHIRTFTKHQIINRPSKTGLPDYDESLRTHGVFTEDSRTEGKGREGNRKGIESTSSSSTAVVNKPQEDRPAEQKPDDDDDQHRKLSLSEFRQLYQECIGVMMPGGLNHEAHAMCGRFPRDRLREAFFLTAEKGGKSLSYVKAILEGDKQKTAGSDWSELWKEANGGTGVSAAGT